MQAIRSYTQSQWRNQSSSLEKQTRPHVTAAFCICSAKDPCMDFDNLCLCHENPYQICPVRYLPCSLQSPNWPAQALHVYEVLRNTSCMCTNTLNPTIEAVCPSCVFNFDTLVPVIERKWYKRKGPNWGLQTFRSSPSLAADLLLRRCPFQMCAPLCILRRGNDPIF